MQGTGAVIVAVLCFLVPQCATAQDEQPPVNPGTLCDITISWSSGCDLGGFHTASRDLFGVSGGNNEHPVDCYWCSTGDPTDCHPYCSPNLSVALRERYFRALRAAAMGNAKEVITLGSRLSGLVVYDVRRSAVQIESCNRSAIIASIPVSGRQLALAATVLSRPSPNRGVDEGKRKPTRLYARNAGVESRALNDLTRD